MHGMKLLVFCVAWLLFALAPANSQDDAENAADTDDTEVAAGDEESDVVSEVLETDDDSYRDIDDEDFRPSEEIPADQSIAFPTDI